MESFSFSASSLIKSTTASTESLPISFLFVSTTGAVTRSYLSKASEASSARSSGLNKTVSEDMTSLTLSFGLFTTITLSGRTPRIDAFLSTTNNLSVLLGNFPSFLK